MNKTKVWIHKVLYQVKCNKLPYLTDRLTEGEIYDVIDEGIDRTGWRWIRVLNNTGYATCSLPLDKFIKI